MSNSLNVADSLPSFELAGVGVYSSSTTPTFASSTQSALCFSTGGNGTGNRLYITQDGGTTWIAITTAS